MANKKTETQCVVQIIPLRLNKTQESLCFAIREEAGKCWTEMVKAHIASRSGIWLNSTDLGKQFKGQFALHSQTIQALAQKLEANVKTIESLKKSNPDAKYPYREKPFQTPTWKEQAIRRKNGDIILSNGSGRRPLILTLPDEYQTSDICRAELTWRAKRYELCITIDTGKVPPPLIRKVKTAGVDLGEINIGAVVTEDGQGIVINGRHLRSIVQLRNKSHATLQAKIDRCKDGSKRQKQLIYKKTCISAKFHRQQRDILHKASRQVIEFCKKENVAHLAIGDVRNVADGANKGKETNQKLSQWAHGKFVAMLEYKGRNEGMNVKQISEAYSSRTCSVCGHVKNNSPRGRVYSCSGCGVRLNRDGNGGANICSRARFGQYTKVQVNNIKYLRPLRLGRSRAVDTRQSCLVDSGEPPRTPCL